jgi:hypothetical protein
MVLLIIDGIQLGAYLMIMIGSAEFPDFEFDDISLKKVKELGKPIEIAPGEVAYSMDAQKLRQFIDYCKNRYLRDTGRKYSARTRYELRFRRFKVCGLGLMFYPAQKQTFRLAWRAR